MLSKIFDKFEKKSHSNGSVGIQKENHNQTSPAQRLHEDLSNSILDEQIEGPGKKMNMLSALDLD